MVANMLGEFSGKVTIRSGRFGIGFGLSMGRSGDWRLWNCDCLEIEKVLYRGFAHMFRPIYY